jgi:glycosyltransferase involved in cell wall biosynthesis
MRIIITYNVSLNNTDTRSNHILGLFNNLRKLSEVYLFVPKIQNITVIDPYIKPIPQLWTPIIGAISFQISLFFHLFIFCSKSNIDAIYNRQDNYTISPLIISKIFKIPFFVEVNGLAVNESKLVNSHSKLRFKLHLILVQFSEKYNYNHAKKIFAVSESIKKGIIQHYNIQPHKIVVLENGTDTELFKPNNTKKVNLGLDDTYKYIGFVGSFAPWHGLEYLIKSAAIVLNKYPCVKYILVGDGILKEKILKMITDLNLENNFILIGQIPHEKVPMYINAFDICVILKNKNIPGSPLKLYEYLSCGKPIIATYSEDFKALSEFNAGILVNPENLEELSSETVSLLINDNLRKTMGNNARKYVLENHSWSRVAKDVHNNIGMVIGQHFVSN